MSRVLPKRVPARFAAAAQESKPDSSLGAAARQRRPRLPKAGSAPPNAALIQSLEAALRADWERVVATFVAADDGEGEGGEPGGARAILGDAAPATRSASAAH